MTCQETVDEFLMRYVDGDLSVSERLRFNLHLAVCADCRRYLDTYRRTVALGQSVSATGEPEMPEQLVQAILEATSHDADKA